GRRGGCLIWPARWGWRTLHGHPVTRRGSLVGRRGVVDTPGVLPPPENAFVGRAPELDALATAAQAAHDGSPALVVVCGDRGVGKTRLTTEALARAAGQGFTVGQGCCTPAAGAAPPGWPFLEALADAGATVAPDGHLFERVRAALVALAAERPVALLVDDLHWADEATVGLVAFLAGALRRE